LSGPKAQQLVKLPKYSFAVLDHIRSFVKTTKKRGGVIRWCVFARFLNLKKSCFLEPFVAYAGSFQDVVLYIRGAKTAALMLRIYISVA
jgi:hypothetical protein